MRKRILLAVLATAALLAGCSDSPSTSTAPTTAPAATTAAPVAEIPAAAFLQTADLGSDGSVDADIPLDMLLDVALDPCGPDFASEAKVQTRKAVRVIYHFTPDEIPNGTAYQVITAYAPGGAADFLGEVRKAVSQCPEIQLSDIAWLRHAIVGENFGGDESVMYSRLRSNIVEGELMEDTKLIAAIRFGDYVVILDADGWELESADRGHIDRLVTAAVSRAAALG